ncbi:MAG: hypothetical protein KKC18_06995 [Chloroflexi bacterium]|nr:hypothetical protein [Chloroflexota bacterium]
MKKFGRWIIVGLVVLTLGALAAWGSSQTPMVARSSEAWSRGQIIGQTSVKRRVALQPASDGGAFLIWQNLEGRLELAHIGEDGKVLQTRLLQIGARQASDPQLQVGPDGRLNLLWREGELSHSTIHYVLLEANGSPASPVQTISDPANPVLDAPCLVADTEDRYHAIWADTAGIRWMPLETEGTPLAEPILVASEGRSPVARADDQGRLHLIWQQRQRAHVEAVYYAVLDLESGAVGKPEEIVEVVLRTGQGVGEPIIALTPETGYVLWEVLDFRYVSSQGEYASFPLESPQQRQIEPLNLREGMNPVGLYAMPGLQTPPLVALSQDVSDPNVAGVIRSQIAVIALGQGAREDIVTASAQASLEPTLVMDDRSNLHLAWLESSEFGVYGVVYATTAPETLKNYNALTLLDVLDTVFSNLFRLSTLIVALMAVLIIWAIIPFLVLVLYHLVTSEETLHTLRSRIALVVVLALEVMLTLIQPPRIGIDAAWPALRWVTPAVTAVITTAMTVYILRRRKDAHLFGVYFMFTGINSLLQMVTYMLF